MNLIRLGYQIILKFLAPTNQEEEPARREFILNVLIGVSIFCFLIINVIRLADIIRNPNDRGLSIFFTLSILGIFIVLGWISKKGWIKTAAWILIVLYSLPMFASFLLWGADLPAGLLLSVLIITFFGVLMGAKKAIISAFVLDAFIITATHLQSTGILQIKNYWRQETNEIPDAITYAVMLTIITAIVWLFDRETEKALKRARESEAALKAERDSLEIKVQERAAKIKEMEMEKINQLYRLAELGRLSSGVFHDLINPLTAVSLNLEQIKNEDEKNLSSAKECLSQAIAASGKMEDLIACIKRSIRQESAKIIFSPETEINAVMKILSYKARKADTEIVFQTEEQISCYGDPTKFSQIIINLISNGIDACAAKATNEPKQIKISLERSNDTIIIKVKDEGGGIHPDNLSLIFEPFFSTKKESGLGIGLSSTKHLIEKEFAGSIELKNNFGTGVLFIIKIPALYEKR